MPQAKRPERALVWADWLRARVETASGNNPIVLSKIAAHDIALLLQKASAHLVPKATPAPEAEPIERLKATDPAPTNKRYPHFEDDVPLERRREVWRQWLRTRQLGAKIGAEGIRDLLAFLGE